MEKFPFSKLLLLVGETILVLGETMWAKLVMGETRYISTPVCTNKRMHVNLVKYK